MSLREYIPRSGMLTSKNCHFEEAVFADEKSHIRAGDFSSQTSLVEMTRSG